MSSGFIFQGGQEESKVEMRRFVCQVPSCKVTRCHLYRNGLLLLGQPMGGEPPPQFPLWALAAQPKPDGTSKPGTRAS